MAKLNGYYYSGLLAAVLVVAVFAGNGVFQSLWADSTGNLPREVRLSLDLGLLTLAQTNSRALNKNISRQSFAEKLATALDLLGHPEATDKNLVKIGIVTTGNKAFSRGEALETLARACMSLKANKMIDFSEAATTDYRDYRISEKYRAAVSYLQRKYVVRGYPNGTFGSKNRLTMKEAVLFIYRFYESVSADLMGARELDGISFIDLPLNHPIMGAIKNLTVSGAFDKIILRPSFDGNSFISATDINDMINGLFNRAGKEIDQIRLQSILAGNDAGTVTNRRQLALILEYILDSFARDRLNANKINYKDISIENPEYEALIKLAGCGLTLGYGDGRFAANDDVTWFEAVNLINEVIIYSKVVDVPVNKPDKLAEKSDIENLKALLRAKREKIRTILRVKETDKSS